MCVPNHQQLPPLRIIISDVRNIAPVWLAPINSIVSMPIIISPWAGLFSVLPRRMPFYTWNFCRKQSSFKDTERSWCSIRFILFAAEEALQDLDGFDMIWVISHMHLNKGWNRKVRPPRLPEERKGLFSTRSPHRPNPVALSSLRVKRVDAARGVIYVQGLDLLDGGLVVCARLEPRSWRLRFTPTSLSKRLFEHNT